MTTSRQALISLRTEFLNNDLVFLKPRIQNSAQEASTCGWLGLSSISDSEISLEKEYPRSARLFRYLKASDGAGVSEMVQKLMRITKDIQKLTDPCNIVYVLGRISQAVSAMSEGGGINIVKDLRTVPVFPVTTDGILYQLQSCKDSDWFIADRLDLFDSFMGIVPLLGIPPSEFKGMEPLFQALGLESKALSSRVTTKTFPQGRVKLLADDTGLFQSRAPFIQAYVLLLLNPHFINDLMHASWWLA